MSFSVFYCFYTTPLLSFNTQYICLLIHIYYYIGGSAEGESSEQQEATFRVRTGEPEALQAPI
jgi:hypothetical protein